MRFRLLHCKHHQRLIHIGHGRTYQLTAARKQTYNAALFFLLIQNLDLHLIAYQGLSALIAKDPFCPAFIETASFHIHIVKACNPFRNPSLHGFKTACQSDGRPVTESSLGSSGLLAEPVLT